MAKGWDKESARHSAAKKFGKAPPYRTEPKMAVYIPPKVDGTHFKINNKITIVARHEDTRNGFRHIADLYINGEKIDSAKVTYQNRTWESYQFQTVLQKLIEDTTYLTDEEKKIGKAFANKSHYDPEPFKSVAMVAKMGDIFGKTQKEKNDWKARMLKAGLGNSGLQMPEDWDTLSEETKKQRLDAAIGFLNKTKEKD
jgi:hypothetical protein